MESNNNLLSVTDLRTFFHTEAGIIPSVNGVTFGIDVGETVAVVGESGCGKSVTALSIMGLVGSPGKIESGEIMFEATDLTKSKPAELRNLRGNDISMIFQEPLTSLNPLFPVGDQISEAIILHQKVNKKNAKERTISMLEKVGIPRARETFSSYPHQLSGGMRQRIMIAMALSCNPKLLIADEPTTALDVTIQAQILELMKDLTNEHNTAIMIITHDLGVVAEMADRVIVMYAGQVVEQADVFTLFKDPKHPYTMGLIGSTPNINESIEILPSIEGVVPTPFEMPTGCKFHPRCPYAFDKCSIAEPPLFELEGGHQSRCWLSEKGDS